MLPIDEYAKGEKADDTTFTLTFTRGRLADVQWGNGQSDRERAATEWPMKEPVQ